MFCHICLSEKVRGEIGRLKLCEECLNKIREYWDETEVKRY
jgi:hypothetical protein